MQLSTIPEDPGQLDSLAASVLDCEQSPQVCQTEEGQNSQGKDSMPAKGRQPREMATPRRVAWGARGREVLCAAVSHPHLLACPGQLPLPLQRTTG